jgi:glycosyltransferase involved in cell wall biosynthesis
MFQVPASFARMGGKKSQVFEAVRNTNIARQTRGACLNQVVRKAERIWTITEAERRIIENLTGGNKATPLIESSPPQGIEGRMRQYDGKKPLRICWSGQHDSGKALPLLLYAMADLSEPDKVSLNVLGAGPQTKHWRMLAEKLSLSNINWLGRLPYQQALQAMDQADLFVHSSIREGTPHVVLEAMAWGMPVICHDACGMAVAVDETCGIKVAFDNPERSIQGFREALEQILNNPPLVEKLSAGALRRASELSWDAKVREMAEAYTGGTN